MENLSNSKKLLLKNTILLYILQFSSQFFALITIPYQTRILGPEIYGRIGFIMSIMMYVQLILDFGFLLSATAKVSLHRDDPTYLNKIYTIVLLTKIILSVVLVIPIIFIGYIVPRLHSDILLLYIFYIAYVINALSPDFFYRGIENMKVITVRTLFIKFLFTIFIFIFLKSPSDYYAVPVLTLIGNLMALISILIYTKKEYHIKMVYVTRREIIIEIKETLPFFISRIASTLYTATNTFVLGIYYPIGPVVGYYTSTDKLVSAVKGFVSPVADSLYPYMMKKKDFKLIKKVIIITTPFIIFAALAGFMFSNKICAFLFGVDYIAAGNILKLLIPVMMVILPSYILAFPTLNPLGLSKYANKSNVYGALFQMIGLIFLALVNKISVYSICILTSITECLILFYRVMVVIRYKYLIKKENSQN